MRKKLLLLFMGLCSMFSTSYAFEMGEKVYTRDSRVQVTGQVNMVVNGNFTVSDVAATDFGWTNGSGTSLNTELMSVEPSLGPNGENCLRSVVATDNIVMQAIQFTAGCSYIVSMQVKGPAGTFCTPIANNSNRIHVYAVKDAGGELTEDNNYQVISADDAITTEWGTLNWSFTDTYGEGGYIIISIEKPTAETLFTNFQVYEATPLGDDRDFLSYIEYAESMINSGYFTNDPEGFVDNVTGMKEAYLAGNLDGDFASEAGVESLITTLQTEEEKYKAANGADMSSYVSSFNFTSWTKYQKKSGSVGDWVLSGKDARWFHTASAEEVTYSFPQAYTLGWGQAAIVTPDLRAGKYMFSIEASASKYVRSKTAAGANNDYQADYSGYATGAYVFIGDTKVEIDTLPNYGFGKYIVYAEVAEGDTLKAGFYFPGFGSGGGVLSIKNPELYLLGTTAEEIANEQYLADIYTQQTQLGLRLDNAKADLDSALPWGKAALTDSLNKYQEVYDASLKIMNPADGTLVDGVTISSIPESYDDVLLAAVRAMNSARKAFYDENVPYTDLVAYVPTAEEILNAEANANASAATRSALEAEIAESKTLIAGVTSETDSLGFVTALVELKAAVVAFTESTASYQNPSSVTIVNADMTDNGGQKSGVCAGWTCEFESGKGIMQFGSDDRFLFGYKAYASRGSGSEPQNKIYQQVTVTKAGVYEFLFQAYAVSTDSKNYAAFWNNLTGEDSVRTAGITAYFAPVENVADSAYKVNILTHQETFESDLWVADEVRDYVLQYVKTTDGEETLEIGFDASRNNQYPDGSSIATHGANLYGFGSPRIYYYGSEETYKTGVEKIQEEAIKATDDVYTISGVKVGKVSDNLGKGLYIVKGKKFVVK